MPSIPLIDAQAQYRAIKAEVDCAIQRVLDSGQYILGPEVEAFEREMAAYCGTREAVAVASGTDALILSLRALGIGLGDEVITSVYSFFATAEAIVAVGATPVFVDIDPRTYTLDPTLLEAVLTAKTKAIIPVHLYGHPCAMREVMAFARSNRLKVIEDCAQALGAQHQGQRVSSFGDAGALSFYPSKNLAACGDGGMVVTNDAAVAEQLRLLRNHGSRERYHHTAVGTNSRLDELQAAILRVKLRHLEAWNDARRRHATSYRDAFRRQGLERVVQAPEELPESQSVYSLYTIRVERRDELQRALSTAGIATQVAYPSTLAEQPPLQPFVRSGQSFPQATKASHHVLSLPMYPELTSALIDHVVRAMSDTLLSASPCAS